MLVADDDRVARLTLRAMIDSDPSLELVALAEDAERAIELAAEHQPDIAVVDVTMPAGGGARATRQIRASSAETRVMALSAHDDRETVVEMLRAGAVGYLVKGTPPSELLATIRRTAMGESSLSPGILGEVVTELSDHLEREERESTGRRERADRIRQVLDQGLLRMAFQPIAELTSGDLVGFEALARFPGDPPRSPDLWFADAAELGMQVELERRGVEDERHASAQRVRGDDRLGGRRTVGRLAAEHRLDRLERLLLARPAGHRDHLVAHVGLDRLPPPARPVAQVALGTNWGQLSETGGTSTQRLWLCRGVSGLVAPPVLGLWFGSPRSPLGSACKAP